MPNLPSGPGPAVKAQSLSVTLATDDQSLTDNAAMVASLATITTNTGRLTPTGPGPGSATAANSKIFNFAITANGASQIDLTGGAYAGLKNAIDAGKLLTLRATVGLWYHWGTGSVTIAAASTATSNPATQGCPLFDGERTDERAPSGTTYLNILGGPVAGTLSIVIAE